MTSYLKRYSRPQRLAHRATVWGLLILMLLWGFAIGFGMKTAEPAAFITAEGVITTNSIDGNGTDDTQNTANNPAKQESNAPPKPEAASGGNQVEVVAKAEDLPTAGKAQDYLIGRMFASILPIAGSQQQQKEDFWNYVAAASFESILPYRFSNDFTLLGQEGWDSNMPSRFSPDEEGLFFWNQQKDNAALNIKDPQIAIYSTHSAETYTPFAGEPKVAGKHGGVYVASTVVAETLAKQNIGVIVDDTIHDYPDWNASYSNSRITASKLLGNHSSIKILIDMHRDAGVPKENSTVEINGKSSARIMLVVGSNKRYKHDHWKENLAFMEKIGDKMEEMYPGLLRTVKVQNGKYNQDLSEHAILIEMGATENTIEEIEYASEMLANVLAEVLKDM